MLYRNKGVIVKSTFEDVVIFQEHCFIAIN